MDPAEQQIEALVGDKSLTEEVRLDLVEKIETYKRLIHKMAHKYVRPRVEYADLIQEALIGLAFACRDFDSTRSEDFHTYAITRMKGRMYDYCISNESPIYVPSHVAKAATHVRQMQRLLECEPQFFESPNLVAEVIAVEEHPIEKELSAPAQEALRELKRKLGNIANNSSRGYEGLAALAAESLAHVVSDEVLAKFPKDSEFVDDIVSNCQLREQLLESLGEKRFTVLLMRKRGWSLREIAAHLAELGYTNRQGKQISRQAVKAILDETLRAVGRMRLFRYLEEEVSRER